MNLVNPQIVTVYELRRRTTWTGHTIPVKMGIELGQ